MSELSTTRLFVRFDGGIRRGMEKSELTDEFREFGEILDVLIIPNESFAFVEFSSNESAKAAVDAKNHTMFLGSKIKVEFARRRNDDRDRRREERSGSPIHNEYFTDSGGRDDNTRDDSIVPMSCVNGVKAPEGYVLVEKSQILKHNTLIKDIEREISRAATRSNDNERILMDHVESFLRNNSGGHVPNRETLVSKFDKFCSTSQLQSKLDKEKSVILKELKRAMPEQQKKLKKSQDGLRRKFENGRTEIEKSYKAELMKGFANKNTLNNSLPVERYVCDELVSNYRDCVETQLVPAMVTMYKEHCNKIDTALKGYVSNYTNFVTRELSTRNRMSPAVASKLNSIKQRLEQMNNVESAQQMQDTLDTVTRSVTTNMNRLQVSAAARQPTPEPTNEEKIEQFLADGERHAALNVALNAVHLELLIDVCKRVPVEDMFQVMPGQFVLLSLMNQLKVDLHLDMETKSAYIQEAIQALDINDDCIRMHGPGQLDDLSNSIQTTRAQIPPADYNRYLKMIVFAVDMMKRSMSAMR